MFGHTSQITALSSLLIITLSLIILLAFNIRVIKWAYLIALFTFLSCLFTTLSKRKTMKVSVKLKPSLIVLPFHILFTKPYIKIDSNVTHMKWRIEKD